jgi:hypothetical protein
MPARRKRAVKEKVTPYVSPFHAAVQAPAPVDDCVAVCRV